MSKKVRIVEVGLRDGLQNEKQILSLSTKMQLAKRLYEAGLKDIELGAYVSPKWVPQMKDTDKLVKKFLSQNFTKARPSVLVPNEKGMEKAIDSGIPEIAIFTAASDTFCEKNINCNIKESFDRFRPVVERAKQHKIRVRAYLSTAFGCPYEGKIRPKKVIDLTHKLLDLGAYEVSLGDTTGVANPKQVEKVLSKALEDLKASSLALHFHDTRGMALANIVKSLEIGIRNFDASIGGLGGCPYAKGASGNVASEDVIHLIEEMGYSTGIDLKAIIKASNWLQSFFKKDFSAKVSKIPLD